MPSFKDDSILIIAPGSRTTLAQLGLPESFTPARHRFRSRMFPAEKEGEWEPHKVRKKRKQAHVEKANASPRNDDAMDVDMDEATYEEDIFSDEGAVWPIQSGRITDWSCFFALLDYVHHQISPPFHTPILLISQPVWTPKEHEKITQFIFERFKCPGFALVDAAVASSYAYGLETACVVDVGADKADVTAIHGFIPSLIGRSAALADCGGQALTNRLHQLLSPQGFSVAMCEQLKKSPICEILPPGVPLPTSQPAKNGTTDSATAPSSEPAPAAGTNAAQPPALPAPAPQTAKAENGGGGGTGGGGAGGAGGGEKADDAVDEEGVLDIAGLVAGGKMNEFLARKEKEKQDKQTTKKKGETAAAPARPVRLRNSEREKATFVYEDQALFDALKDSTMDTASVAEATATLDEGPTASSGNAAPSVQEPSSPKAQAPRRELTVGIERFQAATGPFLTLLSAAIYRTIQSHTTTAARHDLWNNLVIVGNGSGIRGFKDALLSTLQSRYLISPSSATIFTSELPSNTPTPMGTGASTPIAPPPHGPQSSHVNPLLHAATTSAAAGQHLQHPMGLPHPQQLHAAAAATTTAATTTTTNAREHSSHGQTPTSIKVAKVPEYFSEWKDTGSEEAMFLGAQVAARVLFVVNSGTGSDKGFMSRTEYNENGPSGISDYCM